MTGKGLKVIGAGLGRTGTTSLKQALEILGLGPCHHMSEAMLQPLHLVKKWQAVYEGRQEELLHILEDYTSVLDYPGCTHFEYLMEAYPSAKVILSKSSFEKHGFDPLDEKSDLVAMYTQWNTHVKETVPRSRLLVYNVKEGWAPLCEFLDVPVPDVPFPKSNQKGSYQRGNHFEKMKKRVMFWGGLLGVTLGSVFWVSFNSIF